MARPRVYETPEDMEPAIEAYFDQCDEEKRPYTIAGLAYDLGFADRNALTEYEKRDEFSSTVKRARMRVERQRSERLVSGEGNVTGMIFDLKNNFGWKDKQELEHSGPDGGAMVIERRIVDGAPDRNT